MCGCASSTPAPTAPDRADQLTCIPVNATKSTVAKPSTTMYVNLLRMHSTTTWPQYRCHNIKGDVEFGNYQQ